MTSFMVTCDVAKPYPVILGGVGFTHPSKFTLYAEADHEAVAIVIQAVNLTTGRRLDTDIAAPTVDRGVSKVLLRMQLSPGRWHLLLESLAMGIVAQRAVEIQDEEDP